MNYSIMENGFTPTKETQIPIPASSNLKYTFSASKTGSSYAPSAINIGSYTSGAPNMDLIQAKIEHLEKERLDLTIQLHQKGEKDREKKIKMEQAEIKIKELESTNSKLNALLQSAQYESVTLKLDKEDLELELAKKKKDADSSAHFEALDLWNKMSATTSELKRAELDLKELRQERNNLLKDKIEQGEMLETLKTQLNFFHSEFADLKKCKADLEESLLRVEFLQKIESTLEEEVRDLKLELSSVTANSMTEISRLRAENTAQKLEIESLTATIRNLSVEKTHSVLVPVEEYESMLKQVSDIVPMQESLYESERRRRELHNKLQEVRGNIRIFVRCRPFLESDAENSIDSMQPCLSFYKDDTSISLSSTALTSLSSSLRNVRNMPGSPSQPFSFDRIFNPEAKQKDVYREVAELVQSAMDGYRVCILSYGQSGSGKTHTMTGYANQGQSDQQGIIPRSMTDILKQSRAMLTSGWMDVSVSVSVVELYNEELRDLLDGEVAGTSISQTHKKYKINRVNSRVVVSGLTAVPIDTSDLEAGMRQFEALLAQSSAARTTASTGMNEASSRSHLIVMIEIQGKHSDGVTLMQGGLRLCDLAGSERLDRTGNLNDATRLKESVNINKSLSCLSEVLLALHNKAAHIPYRNSKLTMLLQDCLSGDGKTLMFVNVSPTLASAHETLCSLRFASQANQVELGKANKHIFTIVQQPAIEPPVPAAPLLTNSSAARSLTSACAMEKPSSRRNSCISAEAQSISLRSKSEGSIHLSTLLKGDRGSPEGKGKKLASGVKEGVCAMKGSSHELLNASISSSVEDRCGEMDNNSHGMSLQADSDSILSEPKSINSYALKTLSDGERNKRANLPPFSPNERRPNLTAAVRMNLAANRRMSQVGVMEVITNKRKRDVVDSPSTKENQNAVGSILSSGAVRSRFNLRSASSDAVVYSTAQVVSRKGRIEGTTSGVVKGVKAMWRQ